MYRRIRCDGYLSTQPDAWYFLNGEQVTGPSDMLLSWAMDEMRAVPYHLFVEAVINASVKGAASQRDRLGGGKYRVLIEELGELPSLRWASLYVLHSQLLPLPSLQIERRSNP